MNVMDIKIGIMAVTPEGAARAFRDLSIQCYREFGDYKNPYLLMHMQPLLNHVQSFGDKTAWAFMINEGVAQLKSLGAQIIWMPANSSHLVVDALALDGVSFVDMVKSSIEHLEHKTGRPFVLGTTVSLSDQLYFKDAGKLAHCVRPDADDQARLNNIIIHELVQGICTPDSRQFILELVARHRAQGADSIFLACTELPCFFEEGDFGMPVDDCIRTGVDSVLSCIRRKLASGG